MMESQLTAMAEERRTHVNACFFQDEVCGSAKNGFSSKGHKLAVSQASGLGQEQVGSAQRLVARALFTEAVARYLAGTTSERTCSFREL